MVEFREYGPPDEEVEDPVEGGRAEEVVSELKGDLSFIDSDSDNGRLLDQILELVENNYGQK